MCWEAKKKSDIIQFLQLVLCCGTRPREVHLALLWLHTRGGLHMGGLGQWLALYNFEIKFAVLNHAMSECSC